ncbi:ectonucleotide pyrophosphatase/phosphodiesterase [Pseudoflavitalea rhizosphaerae]|uniref:alkaline phosphatase family protein n=1 Tax=Pseudoflavitalea rhizosphaerae TaxID=1884793 RepID=UPI000F8F1446|nr:ectonucleotide pyrophosphatase/phosphodiesterase [Pseudoflavitalea rhizosphaerae]
MGKPSTILYLSLLLLLHGSQLHAQQRSKQNTTQQVEPGRQNSPAQYKKPYVVLISADGFRYDYMQKFNAMNLQRLSKGGVRAKSMVPAFPSLTFPNHYTLVTGLYPAHHGLVDNTFFDPSLKRRYSMGNIKEVTDSTWYGGEPLWVLAEKQQLLSASFYWVGSEAPVQGIRPSYWYHYGTDIAMPDRLTAVKDWLSLPEEKRPHLITFYFPEVDHEAHEHGPDAPETAAAVQLIDQAVGQMQAIIDSSKLPVNVIFVSDHGMSTVDTVNTLRPPDADTSRFWVTISNMIIHLYSKNKDPQEIQSQYKQLKAASNGFDVYLSSSTPRRWQYNSQNDRYGRIGDILILPRYPRTFSWGNRRPIPGRHGYDPYRYKEMHASFYAWGPQIRSGKTIGSFQNVHVYALVANLLGLDITTQTDSRNAVSRKVLR